MLKVKIEKIKIPKWDKFELIYKEQKIANLQLNVALYQDQENFGRGSYRGSEKNMCGSRWSLKPC
jgi:hypothetical protein